MGIESVNFWYEPMKTRASDLVQWLIERGAVPADPDGLYVLRGPDYWIDLQERPTISGTSLHVRVAVTNPVAVVSVLHALLADLLEAFGGTVTDAGTRRVFSELRRDQEELSAEFLAKRRRFTDRYGELALPVSADDVFARLRDQQDSKVTPPEAPAQPGEEDA